MQRTPGGPQQGNQYKRESDEEYDQREMRCHENDSRNEKGES